MFSKRRSASVVRHAIRPVIEGLETRQMLSASLNAHGVLNCPGTGGADSITVSMDPQTPTNLDVTVNGSTQTFVAAYVKSIKVNGAGGSDSITVNSDVTIPTTVIGGSGNDSLVGGGGTDSLTGGSGNDSLTGGTGTDTLLGGTGNDSIMCGDGSDAVNGGSGKDSVQFTPSAGVPASAVPQSIQSGLTTLAQGAGVTTVQPFVEDNHTYYGANVNINGQDTRIVVDAAGNPVGNAPPTRHSSDNQGPSTGQGGPEQEYGIFGTVISVDTTADTITVSAGNPWGAAKTVTFSLSSTTTITADDAAVTLAQLTAGTLVCIQTSSTAPTAATSITAIDPRAGGTVTAIDTTADTLTLTNEAGTATTYTFTSATTVTLDGTASTASAISTGDRVYLTLAALGGDVLSIMDGAPTTTGGDGGGGTGTPVQPPGPGGKVVGVDTTADTITLVNGDGIQSTYTLGTTATVVLDGATSTLSAIVAGDFAILQLATDGTTVTGVAATDQVKTGGGDGNGGGGGGDGGGGDQGGGGTGNPTEPPELFGSVISVNTTADTITFQPVGASISTTYTLATSATVKLDDATSTLSAIVAGDKARLTLSTDGTTVTEIDASDKISPPPVTVPPVQTEGPGGTVVSVDTTANTITLTDGGTQTTYTLTTGASVMLDGAASTLSAIVAGDHAHLTLTSGATTVATVLATDQTTPPGGGGGGDPGEGTTAGGTVVSVNTTANTITLTDGGTQTTYTLATGASVMLDGATSTLSAILAGDHAQLTLTAGATTVASILATDQTTPPGGGGDPGEGTTAGGTVVSVNTTANTITLTDGGKQATYTLATGATVMLDGAASTLSAILAGDHAQLTLTAGATTVAGILATDQTTPPGGGGGDGGGGTNNPAPPVTHGGTVVSVNSTAGTITLTDGGTQTTYTLATGASVMLDGAASTLSAIVAGDHAKVTLTTGATTVTTVLASDTPPPT